MEVVETHLEGGRKCSELNCRRSAVSRVDVGYCDYALVLDPLSLSPVGPAGRALSLQLGMLKCCVTEHHEWKLTYSPLHALLFHAAHMARNSCQNIIHSSKEIEIPPIFQGQECRSVGWTPQWYLWGAVCTNLQCTSSCGKRSGTVLLHVWERTYLTERPIPGDISSVWLYFFFRNSLMSLCCSLTSALERS